MKEARVEVRLRNNILWHAIFDIWSSVTAFCQSCGFQKGTVGRLLNLRMRPYNTKRCEYIRVCPELSKVLGISADVLFPLDLYNIALPRFAVEVSTNQLPASLRKEMLRLPAPSNPCEEAARNEMIELVLKASVRLTSKQKQVFDLIYVEGLTLTEAAARLRLSIERVRQIEHRLLCSVKDALDSPYRVGKIRQISI